jgi:hypothetical protein
MIHVARILPERDLGRESNFQSLNSSPETIAWHPACTCTA